MVARSPLCRRTVPDRPACWASGLAVRPEQRTSLHPIVRSREHSKPEGPLEMRPNIALLHGLIALLFPLSFAQSHDHPSDNVPPHTRLGSVSFEISCHPKVQQDFNHGIAPLHSFWH